jgi:hypothetical protein
MIGYRNGSVTDRVTNGSAYGPIGHAASTT